MERRLDIEKEQDSKQEQEQNNKPMDNPVNVCHRYIINLIFTTIQNRTAQCYRIYISNNSSYQRVIVALIQCGTSNMGICDTQG